MFIAELLNFISFIDKDILQGEIKLTNKQIRSISSYSSKSIYYFPTVVSDQCTPEEVTMVAKALERQYAIFVVTCINLIPFHRIRRSSQGAIEEYLNIFHQNIGINAPTDIQLFESVVKDTYKKQYQNDTEELKLLSENYTPLHEAFAKDCLDNYTRVLYDRYKLNENINFSPPGYEGAGPNDFSDEVQQGAEFKTFGKEVFMKTDVAKANEMVPTLTKVNINFIVDETEETISREVLIGIKVFIRKVSTLDLTSELYNTIINKRKFLKFLKFTSGEERSLADLLLGIKELKSDALNTRTKKNSIWFQAFKRRQRWSKMTIPFLMKAYTPNGSFVMTMNEVEYINDRYGINIMDDDHIKMIMKENYLLGFVVIDQANENVHVAYDAHDYGFQVYTYQALEKEMNMNDRMMRDLYRTFSSR